MIWDEFADSDDVLLSKGTLLVKKNIISLVNKIENEIKKD